MSSTPNDSILSSSLEIPYQDWNRPHLLRRASNPHRTRAEARGHKYTPSEQSAITALRGFVDNGETSKQESIVAGLLVFRLLRRAQVVDSSNPSRLSRSTSMPVRSKQAFVVTGGSVAAPHDYSEPDSLANNILVVKETDGEVQVDDFSLNRLSEGSASLSVVNEAGEALTCERCPLILPGMHQYWGTVRIGSDGDLFCSNGCPEPGMKRVRRIRPKTGN